MTASRGGARGHFCAGCLYGFSTGSSWGAMGILLPLVLPLCWAIMGMEGMTAVRITSFSIPPWRVCWLVRSGVITAHRSRIPR
ncbi:MAG: hypothetical protein CM15mP103_06650 [Gammaproteobacteria bacterium]|nr:MAG: hypothetical protein CM15mP103_06650 [Gammaproteobacteria bacterium]